MGLTRTRLVQTDTSIAKIQDPITVLNSLSTTANTDVGFLINRNLGVNSNVAFIWNETSSEFRIGLTSNTGTTDSAISLSSYANLRVDNFYGNLAGGTQTSNVIISTNLTPSVNAAYSLGSPDRQFNTAWISGPDLHLGTGTITSSGDQWYFTTNGSPVILSADSVFSDVTVTGNLTVQGTQFITTSEDTSFVDSIIDLHTYANLDPLLSNDGRDIGLKFHYYDYQDEHAFLGRANDTGYLEWYDSGNETVGNVFVGTTYGTIKTGGMWLANATISTSTTTGALRVGGGVGIAGALYIANTGDVSANIGSLRIGVDAINANLGSYQLYANANAAGQQTTINSTVANVTVLQSNVDAINANIGEYQTYANANAATQAISINNIVSGANANTAAYLLTATGNIAAGNVIATGNIYGGIVPSAIYKDFYIGTTAVPLNRSPASLTVDNFNTTGYAITANSTPYATNAARTTITSNIASGTAYVTFVSATTGNVDQYVNTALTYNPNSGNLRTYGLLTDTGVYWAGNGAAYGGGGSSSVTVSSTAPSSPNTGDMWWDSDVSTLYIYYSSQWVEATPTIDVYTTGTAPGSPNINDFWWDSTLGKLYLYYNDGSSSQWVEASPQNRVYTSSSAPVGALNGDLWWDTDTGVLYVLYDDGSSTQWVQATPDILVEGPTGTFTLNGNLVVTGDATIQGKLYETSDRKLKNNVRTIDSALDIVEQLRGVEFSWVKDNTLSYGVIAQELEEILPFLVREDPTGTKTVNYSALIGLLIQAIKELHQPKKKSLWTRIKEKFRGR